MSRQNPLLAGFQRLLPEDLKAERLEGCFRGYTRGAGVVLLSKSDSRCLP